MRLTLPDFCLTGYVTRVAVRRQGAKQAWQLTAGSASLSASRPPCGVDDDDVQTERALRSVDHVQQFSSQRLHPDIYMNELLTGMRILHQVLPAIMKKLDIYNEFELDESELHIEGYRAPRSVV
jgi:hypothetical protein